MKKSLQSTKMCSQAQFYLSPPPPARTSPPALPSKGLQVWKKPLASGAVAVVFFNRGSNDSWRRLGRDADGRSAGAGTNTSLKTSESSSTTRTSVSAAPRPPPPPASKISVTWAELGFSEGTAIEVRDLWAKKVLGTFTKGQFSATVDFHGAEIYTFTKT